MKNKITLYTVFVVRIIFLKTKQLSVKSLSGRAWPGILKKTIAHCNVVYYWREASLQWCYVVTSNKMEVVYSEIFQIKGNWKPNWFSSLHSSLRVQPFLKRQFQVHWLAFLCCLLWAWEIYEMDELILLYVLQEVSVISILLELQ